MRDPLKLCSEARMHALVCPLSHFRLASCAIAKKKHQEKRRCRFIVIWEMKEEEEAAGETEDVCWRMLAYADECWRMLTYADVCWADVCWRMLTYADISWWMPWRWIVGTCMQADASSTEQWPVERSISRRRNLDTCSLTNVLTTHVLHISTRPWPTGVWGLKLLVYEALSYSCMRPEATHVWAARD